MRAIYISAAVGELQQSQIALLYKNNGIKYWLSIQLKHVFMLLS